MPRGDLANITRAVLAPLWDRHDITTERIARTLGVTRQAVSWHARRLGLPSRAKVRRTLADEAEFRELWLAGVRISDMQRHFGYAHRSCVGTRARMLGLPKRRTDDVWISRSIPLRAYHEQQLGERMRRAA